MLGKKTRRTLTTVEMHSTPIEHRKVKTRAKIVGTYYEGFIVYVPKERVKLHLPFKNIDDWDVVGKPRRVKKG